MPDPEPKGWWIAERDDTKYLHYAFRINGKEVSRSSRTTDRAEAERIAEEAYKLAKAQEKSMPAPLRTIGDPPRDRFQQANERLDIWRVIVGGKEILSTATRGKSILGGDNLDTSG